jgi:GTP pyrophosphokinase
MIRFEDIYDTVKRHHPEADLELLRKAYIFSAVEHKGQTRASGEPYLIHPLEVAAILADMRMDPVCVAVGLLHDVLEDTLTDPERLKEYFGPDVLHIVEGVTKIGKIPFSTTEERQAENYRKMLLAMVDDVRVILVKLADRLHNMRTLQYLPDERRVRIARETMDIYAPLAGRLGMSKVKNELEDLSFQYLEPEAYKDLAARVGERRQQATEFIERITATVGEKLRGAGLEAAMEGRIKRLYSIHQKLRRQRIDLDQVYDFVALRVLVKGVSDCYAALGVLHNLWRPVPGRIKDFIAMPRPNGYQSLHTSVIGDEGHPFEVQIRTQEMHRVAEEGIAAHWKYKEGKSGFDQDDQAFSWLRQLLEWQQEVKDPHEFLNSLKLDLYPEEVYCFTPKGEVKMLPRGASPVDFAYAIHTEVGHQCVGARVNGKMVSLRYKLKNGDIVEILTGPGQHPSRDWLSYTVTNKAKAKIRHYLNNAEKQQALEIGRKHLERELKRYDLSLKKALSEPARGPGPGARGGDADRRPLRRNRLRQGLGPAGPGPAGPAREARATPRPREGPAHGGRGEALPAGGRGTHQGQGNRRPARLPGHVLQPHPRGADRGLHHPGQGRLRPRPELPQRHEPPLRPGAADRGGVGERGRRVLRGASRGGHRRPSGGPGRGHRGAGGDADRHPGRPGPHLR